VQDAGNKGILILKFCKSNFTGKRDKETGPLPNFHFEAGFG